MLERTAEIVRVTAESKGVAFRLTVGGNMPRFATVDPVRLRQAILNLAGNAVKFTGHGEVEIKAEFERISGSEGLFRFSVKDTGPGITDDQKARLFRAFSQGDASTTRRYGGTGLGLVITVGLLEKMGSALEMESEPGRGSCFSFQLVRQWRDEECGRGKSTEPESGDSFFDIESVPVIGGNYRIVVAEDNEINLELEKAVIKRIVPGARIIGTKDGGETLKACTEGGADIVFMDIQMPVMDGYAVTSAIREAEKSSGAYMPIIAFTAGTVRGEREKCLNAGMDDYMVKPTDFRKLSNLLHRYIGKEYKNGSSLIPEQVVGPVKRFSIDDLSRRLGGDRELLGNLISVTYKYFGGYIDDLARSVTESDHERTRKILHLIKGASLNACFHRLAALVIEFEKNFPCDEARIRELASGIEEEYEYIKGELSESGFLRSMEQL